MIDNCTQIPTTLECKDHVKYLGVLLDSNLSWKFHINNVALKVSRTVGVAARLRHFVPRPTLLNIYQYIFDIALPDIRFGGLGLSCQNPFTKNYRAIKTSASFDVFF